MKSYTMRKMGDTLHRKLKILAAEKGITIQQAILEAIERYISMGEEQKRRMKKEIKENDFKKSN